MLRPIVEAAGYRVVGDEHDGDADLVIAAEGEELPEESATKTIWLRAEPEAAGKKDESIYRYDRAGLLMALKTAGRGEGQMNELLLVVTIAGERVALACGRGRIRGRARHADPGAARRAARRRPFGASQPRADGDRLHALARARRRAIAPTASAKRRSSSSTAIIMR